MRDENKKILADKIAAILQNESGVEGNEQLWKAVSELGKRLEKLEGAAVLNTFPNPSLSSPVHPSLAKYSVVEAVIIPSSDTTQEKTCTFEPNEKPCDHCSMCSSRGF